MTTEHSNPNQHEHISAKLCVQCGEMKPLGDFLRRTGRRAGGQGRRGTCRDCRRGRQSVEALPAKGAARGQQAAAAKHAEARAVAAAAGAEAAAQAQPPADAPGGAPAGSSRRKRGGRSASAAGAEGASAASGAAAASAGAGASAAGVGTPSAPAAARAVNASAANAGASDATAVAAQQPLRSAAARQPAAREAGAPAGAAAPPAAPSDAASAARKPPGRGRKRRPAAQPRLLAEPPKRSTHDPADASYLRTTASGFIRMRGKTDNGRRWYQEVELELAQILVREGAAVVVNRSTIRRLYSNKEFRKLILTRDNYVCRFCGKYGDTIDHELPRAKGGHTTPANCVCACYECNQLKANRDVDEFIRTLE
jgi:hypothetical protein